MKPRRGPVSESAKHQLKFLVQELKRPGESIAELYIRALKGLEDTDRLDWLEEQQDVCWQSDKGHWSGVNGQGLRFSIDAHARGQELLREAP